ncbi:MAG: Uncharacterised protein [Halieaceae bacterium]|nr:MAG: Uncharacterised protein [Halieaceae bacterium]
MILLPRVIKRLAKVPVFPLISTPASIVSVTFCTALPSASVPSLLVVNWPLPFPTVTRPSIRYSKSAVKRVSALIDAGKTQTESDNVVVPAGHSATGSVPPSLPPSLPPPPVSALLLVVLLSTELLSGASIVIVASSPSEQPPRPTRAPQARRANQNCLFIMILPCGLLGPEEPRYCKKM